ncbi:PD40 domain-containing protein [Saccharopolyspora pogona]|uniref:PD40 domain-containing protein n=1 Tax=Saccharopolyspora pogona TaxID=333966 RepID=UPI001683CC35|nr:PD40 domain-containing protein [Saccharopolyspora pogona]
MTSRLVGSERTRIAIAATAAVILAAVAIGYTWLAARPSHDDTAEASTPTQGGVTITGSQLVMLSNGQLSTVARDNPGGPLTITPLQCDRAYAAANTVACLPPADAFVGTKLVVLDRRLREQRSIPLTGFPNRLRVSPSGHLFIDGHSYAAGRFSTSTGILDTRTGQFHQTLEEFTVFRDGRPYQASDINYLGVTFSNDDNRFYATMSTAGHRYLVEGDFAAKTVRTLRDNVECPSLSPDGTRIAYKSAIDGDPNRGWRLSVLDLATQQITPLAETRSVDDQPAWLDNTTVAYALQRSDGVNDTWAVPANGSGTPELLVPEANSPAALS